MPRGVIFFRLMDIMLNNAYFLVAWSVDAFIHDKDSASCVDGSWWVCVFDGCHEIIKMLDKGVSFFISNRFFRLLIWFFIFWSFGNGLSFGFHREYLLLLSTMRINYEWKFIIKVLWGIWKRIYRVLIETRTKIRI